MNIKAYISESFFSEFFHLLSAVRSCRQTTHTLSCAGLFTDKLKGTPYTDYGFSTDLAQNPLGQT